MRKRTFDSLRQKIDVRIKRISAERDRLRDLIDDAEAVHCECQEAIDELDTAKGCIERANDALSKYL